MASRDLSDTSAAYDSEHAPTAKIEREAQHGPKTNTTDGGHPKIRGHTGAQLQVTRSLADLQHTYGTARPLPPAFILLFGLFADALLHRHGFPGLLDRAQVVLDV